MIKIIIDNIRSYLRFFFGLKGYLNESSSIEDVKPFLKERMKKREENFLNLIKRGVFEFKGSPYLPLFNMAKIGYDDVVGLVNARGIEAALEVLRDAGVYITIDEFKTRKPIERNGQTFVIKENQFNNPYISPTHKRWTGGSRGRSSSMPVDFDFLFANAMQEGIIGLESGMDSAPAIIVRPAFPYGVGMTTCLRLSKLKIYPERWISLVNYKKVPLSLKTRVGINFILYFARLCGIHLPIPEIMDLNDLGQLAHDISQRVREHGRCFIFTNVSTAVRISLAARKDGVDLTGVIFRGGGEPFTEKKRCEVEASGARQIPAYAVTELGIGGSLCGTPSMSDDIHVFTDYVTVIKHKRMVANEQLEAFLFTTLLPTAPKIMINVETGDYGILEEKECGCLLGDMGYHRHISNIRSFEKLCGEGMTFYSLKAIALVEEILPERFGGSSLDYQFVEEENNDGLVNLTLRIDPTLLLTDEAAVIDVIYNEFSRGNDAQRVMAEVWKNAETIRIKRVSPIVTGAGKILPLHIIKGVVL